MLEGWGGLGCGGMAQVKSLWSLAESTRAEQVLRDDTAWVQSLALPCPSCVTPGDLIS